MAPERSLFRVRFEGQGQGGGLRLALHRAAPDRFQLRASDALGRARWSLSVDHGRSRIIDRRSRRYCDSSADVRVPEVALAPLPVARIPELLAGELPVSAAPGERPDAGEFVDERGRRWTVRRRDGVLETWTLWEGGEPSLWWRRQERGGVLSHRSGSQVRWRRSVVEPMTEALQPLEVPAGFEAVDCALLAELPTDPGG